MAWSIFSPNQGGGDTTAVEWAKALLAKIGAPATPGNVQFVFDWEKSEGGGGKFNPLNQGPVPNHPELTTTGSQYGGGAADFASWEAGLAGAADYLNMPNFSAIKSNLIAGNPAGARSSLINSPWAAGHYGYGSGFSTEALPGGSNALPALTVDGLTGGGAATTASVANADLTGYNLNPADLFGIPGQAASAATGDIFKGFLSDVFPKGMATRLALGFIGIALIIVAAKNFSSSNGAPDIIVQAPGQLAATGRSAYGKLGKGGKGGNSQMKRKEPEDGPEESKESEAGDVGEKEDGPEESKESEAGDVGEKAEEAGETAAEVA